MGLLLTQTTLSEKMSVSYRKLFLGFANLGTVNVSKVGSSTAARKSNKIVNKSVKQNVQISTIVCGYTMKMGS